MVRTSTKAEKPTPTPPATTPEKRTFQTHELLLSPTAQSAVAIEAWSKFAGDVDLAELLDGLREKAGRVLDGDTRPIEAMLYGQAATLETIFTSLARRATKQEHLKQFQAYLGLALKAQAQCRATLEALAEIKNPRPMAFVHQANISGGHQQVINGVSTGTAPVRAGAHPHVEEIASQKNGLLEASHGIELDTRAQSKAGGANPHLEAVATRHRAAHD